MSCLDSKIWYHHWFVIFHVVQLMILEFEVVDEYGLIGVHRLFGPRKLQRIRTCETHPTQP